MEIHRGKAAVPAPTAPDDAASIGSGGEVVGEDAGEAAGEGEAGVRGGGSGGGPPRSGGKSVRSGGDKGPSPKVKPEKGKSARLARALMDFKRYSITSLSTSACPGEVGVGTYRLALWWICAHRCC